MRKQSLVFLFVLVGGLVTVQAQTVSVGALGGVPLTATTRGNDESPRYTFGPSVEVKLPAGFAIEVDALYQRVGNSEVSTYTSYASGSSDVVSVYRQRANSWQFPILGKYYFQRSATWQPFIGTGYSFRTIPWRSHYSATTTTSSGTQSTTSSYDYPNSGIGVGATLVAGARFTSGRIAFLPQVRYTRWSEDGSFPTRRNEVGLFFGISF